MLKATAGDLPGLLILEPALHRDPRGYLLEAYNQRDFEHACGSSARFVQDNHSHSVRNVLRGLHYQVCRPQGKLVRVASGEIYDVVVDVRRSSPTLGRWHGHALSARDGRMLWIPEGYAHGFLVLSDTADVHYKVTDYRYPEHERTLAWNDPALGIRWPLIGKPVLSEKDQRGCLFAEADLLG